MAGDKDEEVSGWIAIPAYFGIATYVALLIIYPRPTIAVTIFLALFIGFILGSQDTEQEEPPQ